MRLRALGKRGNEKHSAMGTLLPYQKQWGWEVIAAPWVSSAAGLLRTSVGCGMPSTSQPYDAEAASRCSLSFFPAITPFPTNALTLSCDSPLHEAAVQVTSPGNPPSMTFPFSTALWKFNFYNYLPQFWSTLAYLAISITNLKEATGCQYCSLSWSGWWFHGCVLFVIVHWAEYLWLECFSVH